MQVKKTNTSSTNLTLTIVADENDLASIKTIALNSFQRKVKVPGFRVGKVPLDVLEKNIQPSALQKEFLDEAIDQLYVSAASQNKIRPVVRPKISVKKFVPFTTLEFEAEIDVIGEVKIADYKKIKVKSSTPEVSETEIKEVIKSLRQRVADTKDVDRKSKDGDQIYIDFKGVDAKTKEPIVGAEGKDYPLIIGSKSFIPGFEDELIGLKSGSDKVFSITFPKDYGVKSLRGRNVEFSIYVTKIREIDLPKVDDEFAKKVAPVESLTQLKADIKNQLQDEKNQQSEREYASELIKKISDKSEVDIPEVLIKDQVARLWTDLQQNVMYQGLTIQEFLEAEDKTEESYRKDVLEPQAADRVKASLVLAEIADKEKIEVTKDELEARMNQLKQQYKDEQMQTELNKPEALQDIAARLLTEKTVALLVKISKPSQK